MELGIVEAASESTIQRALKKTLSKASMSHCRAALAFSARFLVAIWGLANLQRRVSDVQRRRHYDCRPTSGLARSRPGRLADNTIGAMKVSRKS